MKKFILLTIVHFILPLCVARSATLGTAFTYQGRLTDGGTPANGSYDLSFALFCDACNDPCCAIATNGVAVSNGLFTVTLDFGAGVFNGTAYWLAISARTNGATEFTTLSPRQRISPTPYALFASDAATAATANDVASNAVSVSQLKTLAAPASGQVLAFDGSGLTWTNASSAAAAWSLNGNAGTTPGVNFLGTTDNQPLELDVNGSPALRLEPAADPFYGFSPNVIGGAAGNSVHSGVFGATIGGGGASNSVNLTHRIASDFATIAGGLNDIIQSNSDGATISGGDSNLISNDASGSTISGGSQNSIQIGATVSTIGGGAGNVIQTNANYSTICGGLDNMIQNLAFGSTISGGRNNTVQNEAENSSIGGGLQNTIQTDALRSMVGGGELNTIERSASASVIAGGDNNTIHSAANQSTISGGTFNAIGTNSIRATISGGINNVIFAGAELSTIGGGQANHIQSFAYRSTIGGGNVNTIEDMAYSSTVGGGEYNLIRTNAICATIPGGQFCTVAGAHGFAAGYRANAEHEGSFVWADSSAFAFFASSAANEFAVRATGGVRFVSGVDSNGIPVAGVTVAPGSGSWSSLSDRNAKTNFTPVNPRELFERLARLPIQTWNYKSQSNSVRHIGPVAQDFADAFNVGEDERHIATVDADGVALAAIQGLNQKLVEELKQRDAEIQGLRQQLMELKTPLGKQAVHTEGGGR